ncbi:MAG: abortive infection protein [Chloroflexi bacterium]|jgi:membrane protease YdiL (CAAX protease family)|nr:abortive infection protein [Chloroflexota bacterium]
MAVFGPRVRRVIPVGAGGRTPPPLAATRKPPVPWQARDAIIIMVAGLGFLAAALITTLGIFELQAGDLQSSGPRAAISTLVSTGFFLFLLWMIYVLVVKRYRCSLRSLGLRSVSWQWLAAVPFVFALLTFSYVIMLRVMVGIFGPTVHWPKPLTSTTVAATHQPWLEALVILTGVVLTPLAEELLFRGVLYQALRRTMPIGSAALISALIFSGMHLSIVLFVPLALMGFVLAVMFERSGSLVPTILVHACNNGIILLITAGGATS